MGERELSDARGASRRAPASASKGAKSRSPEPRFAAVLALLAIATLAYWAYALRVPFINDDYVFLDAVRGRSFLSLVGLDHLMFGWWRPLSRELHYAVLQRLFGARELPFHAASLALAIAVLGAYFVLVRRVANTQIAAVACAGIAALAAWAVPIVWIAGAQELWMLLFALVAVHAFAFGSLWVATLALAGALFSKETAAVVPGVALATALIVQRMPPGAALRRLVPLALVVVAWAIVHPALGGRLRATPAAPRAAAADSVANVPRAPLGAIAARTALVPLNLDHPIAPERGWARVASRALPSLIVLGALVAWVTAKSRRTSARVVALGAVWALVGWLPVLWPSLGWHSYYTLLGAFGAWLAIAPLLAGRRVLAGAVIAVLVVLRAAQAATPSLDWGSEWYQNRAGAFIDFMRRDLLLKQPDIAPHTRLFFSQVPSNVGFLTASGPALRVWYGDTTVSGGYLGQYARRDPSRPAGADLFFRYDSTSGWVPIATGAEDTAAARLANPRWEADHRQLAAAYARAQQWREAGWEYARLAAVAPEHAEIAADAAVCFAMAGDSVAAARWFEVAARSADADDDVRRFAREFAHHLRSRR